MELYCSLVRQQQAKNNPSLSDCEEPVESRNETVCSKVSCRLAGSTSTQQSQVSHTSVGKKYKEMANTSADRFKEEQLLHQMGSLFPKLGIAEMKLAKSLKQLHNARRPQVTETVAKARDANNQLIKQNAAAVPPSLSDVTVQAINYFYVKDPMKKWKVEDRTSQWFTEDDKREFMKKFKQYGKSFGTIASFIPNKSESDCVKYYNFNKHSEDLRAIRKGKKPDHRKPKVPDFSRNIRLPLSGMSTKSPRPVLLPRQYENYRTCSNCSMRIALSDQGVITRSSINSQNSVEVVRNSSVQNSSGDPCNRCRKMFFRKRFRQGRCQVYQCVGQLRRCWTEKSLPADFSKLDAAMKQGLLAEYRLNPDSFTSCFNCIKRIKQKINNFLNLYNDEVNDDEPYSSAISCFTEEEQRMLRDVLFSGCCSSWDEVANQIPNKSAKECRRYANENKSVIFDCTLLKSAVESVHEHAENNGGEGNGSETIGAPSENTTTTSAKNAEPVAVQPPYTCLRAVLNAISSVEPVTTSEEAPCQGVEPSSNRTSQNQGTTTSAKNAETVIVQPKDTCVRAVLAAISTVEPMVTSEEAPRQRVEPSGNHRSPILCTTSSAKNAEPVIVQPKGTCVRAVLNAVSTAEPMIATEKAPRQPVEPSGNRTSPKPSRNIKFAFHPSPCAKLQEEAMASTSAVTKQNTDSRRSTDASFALPKDVGSNGVAALLENASVGRQSAVMSTSPSEVESSSFNARPLLGGCSSISSETGSGVHLNNSNYLNNFATLPIVPLSFGPGHSVNDLYASGISSTTSGAFRGQPIDLGRPRPTPIAECLYSNLCSPGVNGSRQYSIDSTFGRQQRLEPGTSASAHSNVVPRADHRKRLVQRSRMERINPKRIRSRGSASVPTVSAAYAGTGQNNVSASFANSAYQSPSGLALNPLSPLLQYMYFAGYQAGGANSLINQSNLNGYGASPFYAAGNNYHQTVQNSLLQYVGYPLYIRNVNPPQYVMGSISNRRITERQEPAIPATCGTSSVVASSSSNGSNRGKTKVEQVFTFLDCSDDESL